MAIDTETGATQTVEGIDAGTLWLELPALETEDTPERGSEFEPGPEADPAVSPGGTDSCVSLNDTTPTPLGMFASGLDDDMSITAMLDAAGGWGWGGDIAGSDPPQVSEVGAAAVTCRGLTLESENILNYC